MICHETGRAAQTDWQVIKKGAQETRVKLSPKTGRSHQLRVHMLALGHPILGDPFLWHAGKPSGPAPDATFPTACVYVIQMVAN